MVGRSIDDVVIVAGYACPWCPTRYYAVSCDQEALVLFEQHLDIHFATSSVPAKAGAA